MQRRTIAEAVGASGSIPPGLTMCSDATSPRPCTAPIVLGNRRPMRTSSGMEDFAHLAGVLHQALLLDHAQVGQHGRRADRIAGVRRGHGPGRIEVHHVRPADHGRDRQPARKCPCRSRSGRARRRSARSPSTLPVRPKPACTSSKISRAPCWSHQRRSFWHVLGRREAGVAALVGLAHHAGHAGRASRPDRPAPSRKTSKLRVGAAETVGKRHLHHVLVEVDDPLLQRRECRRPSGRRACGRGRRSGR